MHVVLAGHASFFSGWLPVPKCRVHVIQSVIRSNTKNGTDDPPIAIKTGKSNVRTSAAELVYAGKVVGRFRYSAHKPLLSCGARLIFETDVLEVRPVDP